MMWLAWRQHRAQVLFGVAALGALAAVLVPTGVYMHSVFTDTGLDRCVSASAESASCDQLVRAFRDRFEVLQPFVILLLVLPLLAGLFFGAPLVARDVEQGSHRLLWTQSVPRRHWTAVKVGLVLVVTSVLAAVSALLAYWWLTPFAEMHDGRLMSGLFDMQGLVPVGYCLFAVSLGILGGVVTRRVLPAMALTLGGFVVVRVGVALARPYLLPTQERHLPVLGSGQEPVGDWVLSSAIYDASGQRFAEGFILCPPGTADRACAGVEPGEYNLQVIHPASQLWPFQLLETGIFVVLAAGLLLLALRQIRRIA